MVRPFIAAVLAAWLGFFVVGVSEAAAQDGRQNAPGEFDFYVLALSWSPSYCAATAERAARRGQQASDRPERRRRGNLQCSGTRPYSFIVHGLWPQYVKGFPEYCQVPAPRLNRRIVAAMLDLMPSRRLVYHQWDRHGVCSGLSARRYFQAVRKARALVKIPPDYIELTTALTVTPGEVERAFIKANPGLSADGIAVRCDRTRLREVRICLSRDFRFRACLEVDRRTCRRQRLAMPPVRGGPARDQPVRGEPAHDERASSRSASDGLSEGGAAGED